MLEAASGSQQDQAAYPQGCCLHNTGALSPLCHPRGPGALSHTAGAGRSPLPCPRPSTDAEHLLSPLVYCGRTYRKSQRAAGRQGGGSGDVGLDLPGGSAPALQAQTRRHGSPALPALQVLGGFSRHAAISCPKQLTNLHRNWRRPRVSEIRLLRAPLQHTALPQTEGEEVGLSAPLFPIPTWLYL